MNLIQSEYGKIANGDQIVKPDNQTDAFINGHIFNITNYKTPTFCDFCSQLLVGLRKQGFKCERKIFPPV